MTGRRFTASHRLAVVLLVATCASGAAAQPAPSGPLGDVPAGMVLVAHVPEAARVIAEIDRLLETMHLDPERNPLKEDVREAGLGQVLTPRSAVTYVAAPSAHPGDGMSWAMIVSGIDPTKLMRGQERDELGIYRRLNAAPLMIVGPEEVAVGDAEILPTLARAARGVQLGADQAEVLADADVMVHIDVPLYVSTLEERYRRLRESLVGESVSAGQTGDAKQTAAAQERVVAIERLWARCHEVTAVTGGLIVGPQAVDARLSVVVAADSALSHTLSNHPPLAGELNPPIRQQEFAALGYASFDPERLAGLCQWSTDALIDWAAVFGPRERAMGSAEIGALRRLFTDFGTLLGPRAGFVVPVRPAREPVLQVDAIMELRDESTGPAWRGQLPSTLDALVYLARVLAGRRDGAPGAITIESMLEPALPAADPPYDRWLLMIMPAEAPAEGQGRTPGWRLLDGLLGHDGLSLWSTTAGRFGCLSIAPVPDRIPEMLARADAAELGQAGDGPRVAAALRHVLRRSNVVALFSPSVAMQLVSRTILRGLGPGARQQADEVPIVPSESLAALSVRFSADSLTARLHIPAAELESVFSGYRVLERLRDVREAPEIAPDR